MTRSVAVHLLGGEDRRCASEEAGGRLGVTGLRIGGEFKFDHWPDPKRNIFCKGFIEQLREAWDQGIADFIFPVLGRFDNQIKGTSLYKLAILDETDVKTVTAARGRLSEELHASAETLNPETVSHAALFAEIGKLEAWLADIAQRQKDAKAPVTSYA